MKHVFIIGSKGIPAQYGGFETFVENLTRKKVREDIHYYVACMSDHEETISYNGADCFYIKVPQIGPAKAVYYDMAAFRWCNAYIRKNGIEDAIVYVLACRIGPFVGHYKRQLHRQGGLLYVNPDGHEWKRAKWNAMIRRYWKLSERLMVKHADLLVCDSKNIECYIREDYRSYHPQTTFLAYGTTALADSPEEKAAVQKLDEWYQEHDIERDNYYLVVGRFVPENNYETMIREYMKSDTKRRFVLITNVEHNRFYEQLREKTGFDTDSRICFAGTVYDEELLTQIRKHAYGYLHGHEVGGTNPSLLEALATTDLNLLLDVGFNREVGEDGARYWSKEDGQLAALLHEADQMTAQARRALGQIAHERMRSYYSWSGIVEQYETLFTGGEVRISVVVATYNGERYLREQLDSILVNLGELDEVVITDDGSTDQTLAIVEEYIGADHRIRLVTGPGRGIKQNVSCGIAQARGAYIFLADQDDIWAKDKVQIVMDTFVKRRATLVVHDAVVVDASDENVLMESFGAYRGQGAGVLSNLIKNKYIGCCMAFRRELIPYILPIPDDIQMHDQWIGMWNDRKFHRTVFITDKLLHYRRHEANVSDFSHHTFFQMIGLRILFLKRFLRKIG